MINKNFTIELKHIHKNGEFEGYASIFNIVDYHGDIIKPKSFVYSLQNQPIHEVKMFFDHNYDTEIGKWTNIQEDDRGLFVKGTLFQNKNYNNLYHAMKNKTVSGLSIGFIPIISLQKSNIREIFQIDLKEISVVSKPANDFARLL